MPARLVYPPKAYVYTKNQAGTTLDVSAYVVSGQVQRLINQVSTAEVVLRNPYKRFTTPSQGVAFHPMDPITIYLERLPGFPVRVFTGYLDSTPYYQMYPGTITLTASCTLKRLLYTWFDPSLPYVIAFFEKYGWINTGQGSIISSKAFNATGQAITQADVNSGKLPFTALQDGSLGKLLWAILYDIGEWQDSHIYVENLPAGANGIAARMAKLMSSLQASQKVASADFTAFLNGVIGSSSYGSGGGNTGSTTTAPKTPDGGYTQTSWAATLLNMLGDSITNANMQAIIGWENAEGGNWNNSARYNPLNTTQAAPGSTVVNSAGVRSYTSWAQGLTATVQTLNNGDYGGILQALQNGNDAQAVALAIGASPWGTNASLVQQTIASAPNNLGGYNTPGAKATGTNPATTTTQSGATAPAKSTNTIFSGYVNPFSQITSGLSPERIDMGVDYNAPAGSQIVAIGNATIFAVASSGTRWTSPLNTEAFVGYTLNDGPLKGKSIYVAEDITPAANLTVGSKVSAGDVIATFLSSSTGIETGWATGSGYGSLAASLNQQNPGGDPGAWATASGLNFNAFLKSLGAPSGTPNAGGNAPGQSMPPKWPTSFGDITTTTGSTGAATGVSSSTTAQAFVAELQFPSVEDQVTAIALGAEHKGLMHDQSLLPFVQQVAQASMRSFQSLPDGSFYAFYPDYFGEMGHHTPYWYIRDIEILSGGINLTDDALATHVFAVGDNTWPVNNELLNMLFSAGTVNIFNAFVGNGIIDTSTTSQRSGGLVPGIMKADEAVKFIERYGARPLVQDYPMVRSPIYEMLLAYQQFMLAWSNQFQTPFTFTFMPELFPGGKVGFPDHGIQMYINSVTHSWNYQEGGFTTTAELSAPALLQGVNAADFPDIPPFMVSALIEPLRANPPGTQIELVTLTQQQAEQAVQFKINQLNNDAA